MTSCFVCFLAGSCTWLFSFFQAAQGSLSCAQVLAFYVGLRL